MIDFPWPVDVGKMAKTSSGFRIPNEALFCGSDSSVALCQRNGFEELMTKYLRKYSWR